MFRAAFAAGLVLLATASPGLAQSTRSPQPPSPPAPVTRILAIGTLAPGGSMAAIRAILPAEVKATVLLYLDGRIDQWYSLADGKGVVFLLNMTDPGKAHAMLEALPLGRAHLMRFALMPLAPLAPLRALPGIGGGAR
ncbi:MAG: hypothetical protein KGL12_08055 [Rhodospirillales bacterium]|nr:hypothetical protein [Rhodospirillales bacterium]